MIKEIDSKNLYESTVRLLSEDTIKNREIKSPIPIFFHALPDDEELFDLAHEAFTSKKTDQIVLNGSSGERIKDSKSGGAWDGFEAYRNKLMYLGVPRSNISCAEPAFNSKEENDEFLDFAMKQNWKSAMILCQPYRALRFILGMVKSMETRGYWMNVWILTPNYVSWKKTVTRSRGTRGLPRKDLIYEEFIRIPQYIRKNDLVSLKKLVEYLDKRDNNELI